MRPINERQPAPSLFLNRVEDEDPLSLELVQESALAGCHELHASACTLCHSRPSCSNVPPSSTEAHTEGDLPRPRLAEEDGDRGDAASPSRVDEMGLGEVVSIAGGFKAWKAADGPVENA